MRYGTLFNRATIAGLASIAAWLAVTASCKSNSGEGGDLTDPGAEDGGGVGPQSFFEFRVFRETIQPALDKAEEKGCTAGACHGSEGGAGGFKLFREPAAGSAEELANFTAITEFAGDNPKVNLDTPNQSLIYNQAKNKHSGGKSALMSAEQQGALLQWIQEAKAARDGADPNPPGNPDQDGGATPNGCVDPNQFALGAFTSDILPILFGEKDYNRQDQIGNGNGCAGSSCHGVDRPGALTIKKGASPAENLKSFACYVNVKNPVQSQIVICPLGRNACKKSPHPGNSVFTSPADLNYQRLLSFLYATKSASTPLDFAFFARQVAPIFENTQIGGAAGRSCAETTQCHGVGSQNQAPPNGSNLPMITGAIDKNRLQFSFGMASNFTSFFEPKDSYLFLYPTNEIARNPDVDPGASKFAKGVAHTGGKLLNVSSEDAQKILTWAEGLRLQNTRQLNWLIAGDFFTNSINNNTGVGNEAAIAPSLFDRSGTNNFNGGIWEGLFSTSSSGFVNFDDQFNRAPTDRVAYAVSYAVNTRSNNILARATIRSNNAIKLFVDGVPVVTADDARNGATANLTLTAASADKKSTRMLVKVLQRRADPNFGFVFELTDEDGNALRTDDVIIKLSPDGGI